jgi:hypothetical protein
MSRWLFLILIAVTLSGCCGLGAGCGVVPSSARLLAWDGLGPDNFNRPQKRSTRIARSKPTVTVAAKVEQPSNKEAELAGLPKNSPEWWTLHDQVEADADAKLARNLIICRGCFPSNPDDRTGSVK